jgi:hypothetical protein
MSYVPPHLRKSALSTDSTMPQLNHPFRRDRRPPYRTHEKSPSEIEAEETRKARHRGLDKTEENFPALGKITQSATWNTNSRKFSELASDWKNDEDSRKESEEREKETTRKETGVFVLPMFRHTRRFSHTEEPEQEEAPAPKNEDDTWTCIEKKKYKPKADRSLSHEDTEEKNEEDDTVWSAPEEHETCWDEPRY